METNTNPTALAQQGAGAEIMPAQSVPTETAVQTAQPATAAQPAAAAQPATVAQPAYQTPTKFCKHCGQTIPAEAVICTHCGCQVEEMKSAAPAAGQIVINNSNTNTNTNVNANINGAGVPRGKPKNKWVTFTLWLLLGLVGGHKFYEGKIGTGILYMFTGGLFFIGWIIDLFAILNKPNPYYV